FRGRARSRSPLTQLATAWRNTLAVSSLFSLLSPVSSLDSYGLAAMPGLIAIVGRPNVGKSALFNRIVGRRIAIVHDQPGVTRDRISAEVEWRGRAFNIVDTGGIGLAPREASHDKIIAAARQQVDVAIEAASLIIYTGDV